MGGDPLLKLYKGSLFLMLSAVYDKYEWLPIKFTKQGTSEATKDSDSTHAKLELISQELNIKVPIDWYNVSQEVLNFEITHIKYFFKRT
jgi:hypothetical protein